MLHLKKKKSQCGRRGERIFSNICVMPSLIGVLIFFLIPFGIVVYYSLINNPIMQEFVGLDNYKRLIETVLAEFDKAVTAAVSQGRPVHFLPPARYYNTSKLSELTGIPSDAVRKVAPMSLDGGKHASEELVKAVVAAISSAVPSTSPK